MPRRLVIASFSPEPIQSYVHENMKFLITTPISAPISRHFEKSRDSDSESIPD